MTEIFAKQHHERGRITPRSLEDRRAKITVDRAAAEAMARVMAHAKPYTASHKYDNAVEHFAELYGYVRGRFLANRLSRMIRRCGDDACLSHMRVCKVGNTHEEDEYDRTRESGCCGSSDEEFVFWVRVAGVPVYRERYRLGFNYGH